MFEFDLQRFDEGENRQGEQESIPEELGGLPEEYAREVLTESEKTQAEVEPEAEPQVEEKPAEEEISREKYQAAIEESNRLRAQLAEYQNQQQTQPQNTQQQPQFQPPQLRITPEISKKINQAITAEALKLSGLSKEDTEKIDYTDEDDPRVAQWNQAKLIAQSNVFNAIRQAQIYQQQQAQQFLANQTAAVNTYNEFVQKIIKE